MTTDRIAALEAVADAARRCPRKLIRRRLPPQISRRKLSICSFASTLSPRKIQNELSNLSR